jgi:ribosomal protein L34E
MFSYADDFTIAETYSDVSLLEPKLTEDFEIITAWAKGKKLSIEPSKSQVMLFSSDPHQANYHPQVFINGGLVPLNKQLRILGIDQGKSACYNNQLGSSEVKSARRVPILKTLGGQEFGANKETLLQTFRSMSSQYLNMESPSGTQQQARRRQASSGPKQCSTDGHRLQQDDAHRPPSFRDIHSQGCRPSRPPEHTIFGKCHDTRSRLS